MILETGVHRAKDEDLHDLTIMVATIYVKRKWLGQSMDFTQLQMNVTNRIVNLPIGNATRQWKIQHVQMILDSSHILGAKWDAHQLRLTAASPTQSFSATWAGQPGFSEGKLEAWLPFEELCGFDMLGALKHIQP